MISINYQSLFQYKNYYKFLPLLICPFYVWGPFALELLFLLIVFISFIKFRTDYIEFYYNYKKLIFLFLMFYFLLIFSSLQSNFFQETILSSFFYFRFFLYFLSSSFLIINNKLEKKLSLSIFLTCSVLIFDGLYQYFTGYNIFGLGHLPGRITSFFVDEYRYGSFIQIFTPLSLSYFILEKKQKSYLIILLFLILALCATYVSGERKAFVLSFINILFIFSVVFNEKKKFFLLFFTIAIILLGLASLKNINTFKKTFYFTSSQIYDGEKFYFFSKRHTGHYKTALNIFSENFLIGAGPKSFRYECKKFEKEIEYACSTHPHNFYLQSLSEIGIFGFIFILSIFFIVTYSLYKLYFKTNRINDIQSVKIIMIFSLFLNLFPLMPSGNMFNNYISMSFVIMLTNFYIFYKFKN